MNETVSKNSFALWLDIITNPFSGFRAINEKTRIALPLALVLVASMLSSLLLQPIMSSKVYESAILDIQIAAIEKKQGGTMSEEMKASYSAQLSSPMVKTITKVSSIVGAPIGYAILIFASALILLIVSALMKEKRKFGIFLRILVFAMIVTVVQTLLKNIITLTGDWESALKAAGNAMELGRALSAPISLASITTSGDISPSAYFLLDGLTDIFNWLYYIFVYAGLTACAGIQKNKAIILTVVIAVIGMGIGFLSVALN